MRIAMFADCHFPLINGVVTSIEILRSSLQLLGHQVFLFVPSSNGATKCSEGTFTFRSTRISKKIEQQFTFPLPRFNVAKLRNLKLDAIHVHSPFNVGLMGRMYAKILNLPLITTHHTLWEEYTHYFPMIPHSLLRHIGIRISRDLCNASDAVIAPSGLIRDRLIIQGVVRPVFVLPTGIDPSMFCGGNQALVQINEGDTEVEQTFVYVGRLAVEKSVDFLLRAFTKILCSKPKSRLLIVGDGPSRQDLVKLAEDLNITKKVSFCGFVDRPLLKHYLAKADIFLFPSTTETQGLSTLEAMAAGKPVVAVHGTGTCEIVVDNVTGFLTEKNVDVFSSRVIELLDDRSKLLSFAKAGKERAKEFLAATTADKMLKIYSDACLRLLTKSASPLHFSKAL